jgi:rod shape-determining protein MreC
VATHQDDFFTRGPSPLARVTFFALLAIGVMIADHRFGALDQVRSAIATALTPVEYVLRLPGEGVRRTSAYFQTQTELIAENKALNEKLLALTADGQRARLIVAEAAHVSAITSAQARTGREGTVAEVIRDARNPFARKVVINRGTVHGVARGAAVIDGEGVVGQVTALGAVSSEVTLTTEKDLSIPVLVLRTGYRAIAVGSGREGVIEMPFIPVSADVQVGDQLVTSGIDGTYPAGLAVAKVTFVDKNPGYSFARIVAIPAAAPDHHRFVKVINQTAIKSAPPSSPAAPSGTPQAAVPATPAPAPSAAATEGNAPATPTAPATSSAPPNIETPAPTKTAAAAITDPLAYPSVDVVANQSADASKTKREARLDAKRHVRER